MNALPLSNSTTVLVAVLRDVADHAFKREFRPDGLDADVPGATLACGGTGCRKSAGPV
jgi:hypothetical protein